MLTEKFFPKNLIESAIKKFTENKTLGNKNLVSEKLFTALIDAGFNIPIHLYRLKTSALLQRDLKE